MRDFRSVLNVIGILLCIEAIAMSIPMFTDLFFGNQDWQIFFFTSIITFFIGLVLYFSFRNQVTKIKIREAFFLTVLIRALPGREGTLKESTLKDFFVVGFSFMDFFIWESWFFTTLGCLKVLIRYLTHFKAQQYENL